MIVSVGPLGGVPFSTFRNDTSDSTNKNLIPKYENVLKKHFWPLKSGFLVLGSEKLRHESSTLILYKELSMSISIFQSQWVSP